MRRVNRMVLTLTLALLLLAACSSGAETSVEAPAGFAYQRITFPTGELDKTEHNAAVFNIDPFILRMLLPDGWDVLEITPLMKNEYDGCTPVDGIFSVCCICNDTGRIVGTVGYNLAPPVETGLRDPMALFAGITLAKHHFDCKEAFDPVVETDAFLSATTAVVHSHSPMEGKEDFSNDGILARDEDIGVYVAIEIEKNQLTSEQITQIAENLVLERS